MAGPLQDAFFMLAAEELLGAFEDEEGDGGIQRKCPSCGLAVPEVGSFFWLHLSQCDPQAFGHYAEGSSFPNRPSRGPTDVTLRGASEAARKRRQAADALLSAAEIDLQDEGTREESLQELAGLAKDMAERLSTKKTDAKYDNDEQIESNWIPNSNQPLIGPARGAYAPLNEPLLKL